MSRVFYLLPYLAVITGLYCLHSAWAAVLIYDVGMLAVLVTRRFNWNRMFRGWKWRMATTLIIVGMLAGPAILVLQEWLFGSSGDAVVSLRSSLVALGLDTRSWLWLAIYFPVVNPFLEEAFWRGELISTGARVTVADVAFAGYHVLVLLQFTHIAAAVVAGILILGAAFVWRHCALRYHGLAVPFVSHLAANLAIILAVTRIAAP